MRRQNDAMKGSFITPGTTKGSLITPGATKGSLITPGSGEVR
ncbi:hypothetical protein H4W32_007734 [Actinophytocola algeriensis]|uniref:Uncharacterized protein n=1 Tax=Actinophytocola algeriensis TaxID=1768010 RepID=A0A7W7VEW1_9PSEU|nr:hypothetical protein [Actinophytocola algeriensis]MBE1479692.1 hypothetical protein [Actinophytocola algeriensis]